MAQTALSRCLPLLLFLFTFYTSTVVSVKQEDFKLCHQSGFCTRQRAYAEYARKSEFLTSNEKQAITSYSIIKKSLVWDVKDGRVSGQLLNSRDQVQLNFALNFYGEGIVRMQVEDPGRQRYRVADVLIDGGMYR